MQRAILDPAREDGPYLLLSVELSGGYDGCDADVTPTLRRFDTLDDAAAAFCELGSYELHPGRVWLFDAYLQELDTSKIEAVVTRVQAKRDEQDARNRAATEAHERALYERLRARFGGLP